MAVTMHIDIVSAESEIFSGTATMMVAPAEMGEVGVAARHAPMITRLKAGEIRILNENDNTEKDFFVSGGILEVQPHVVTVLADTALRADDIDENAALEAKKRAEELLASAKGEQDAEFDYKKAQAELLESVARLQTLKKMRERK
ncbi:MAG: F0F1 ATP synthase subunit epsilon [Gammaproteobacteria bacterium]|nr:F0F1 ATP synthase subunit epsilon [Gammaproteobacteria bacterium]